METISNSGIFSAHRESRGLRVEKSSSGCDTPHPSKLVHAQILGVRAVAELIEKQFSPPMGPSRGVGVVRADKPHWLPPSEVSILGGKKEFHFALVPRHFFHFETA